MDVRRVPPEDFLAQIKVAPRWMTAFVDGQFELSVKEHGIWTKVFTPDLTEMSDLEVEAFMAQVRKITSNPIINRQRVA